MANAYSDLSSIGGYTVTDRISSADAYDSVYMGYTGTDYSGYYLGTIIGENDSVTDLETLISYYLDDTPYDVDFYSKIDAPATNNTDGLVITIGTGGLGGTWDTTGITPTASLEFYAVKGSKEYALYFLNPTEQTGTWTTQHLLNKGGNQPGISHFSSSLVAGPEPVPEPATMLLFGTGLVGLAGARFRKKK